MGVILDRFRVISIASFNLDAVVGAGGSWARAYPHYPILPRFRPSRLSANDGRGHLESDAFIGIEFGEFRQNMRYWNVGKIQASGNPWV